MIYSLETAESKFVVVQKSRIRHVRFLLFFKQRTKSSNVLALCTYYSLTSSDGILHLLNMLATQKVVK